MKKDWNSTLPMTPGYDFSGIITALPSEEDCFGFQVGDEVFGANWGNGRHDDLSRPDWPLAGTFSEYCMVPLSRLSRKPRVISFDDAAAIATAGCTAYQCVSEVADVKAGQRVLVLGGDTAVGSMFIELAKMAGAW